MNRTLRLPGSLLALTGIAFFLSGGAALVYQVYWMRLLSLLVGSSLESMSLVVGAFMAGLALGSYFLGRLADSDSRPGMSLLIYVILECVILAFALASPLLFASVDSLLLGLERAWLGADGQIPLFLVFLKVFVLFVLLLVPTTCMGGTLPILARCLSTGREDIGPQLSLLYAINTWGAVFGVVLSGFVILPYWGMPTTLASGMILNTCAVALAGIAVAGSLGSQSGFPEEKGSPKATDRVTAGEVSPSSLSPRVAVILAGLSGLASFILEVVWARSISLVLGSSAYASSLVLVAFLSGLALGGGFARRLADDRRNLGQHVGVMYIALGMLGGFSFLYLGRAPLVYVWLFPYLHDSFGGILTLQAAVVLPALLPATVLMGAAFPLLGAASVKDSQHVGGDIGRMVALNTLGAVTGSLFAGFVGVPVLGTEMTFLAGSALYLLAGLVALMQQGDAALAGRLKLLALTGMAFLVALGVTGWDRLLMSRGVYMYAGAQQEGFAREGLLFYQEGRHCTVAVTRRGETITLRLNGKADGSTGSDMATQVLLGALPMAFADNADNTLVIGVGTGVTAGTVLTGDTKRLTCLEIEHAVIEATKYFENYNGQFLRDPRTLLVLDDARHFLRRTEEQYGLIISEPSNPWMQGVSSLFARECFEMLKARLSKDGVICQWLQLYQMPPDDLRMILATFREVFPGASVFRGSTGDVLLVARKSGQLVFDIDHVQDLLNRDFFRNLVLPAGISKPGDFISRFLLGPQDLERVTEGAPLNTDAHPIIEFSAARSLYKDTAMQNMALITMSLTTGEPPFELVGGTPAGQAETLFVWSLAESQKSRPEFARALFREAIKRFPDSEHRHYANGMLAVSEHDLAQAFQSFARDAERNPDNPRGLMNQVLVRFQQGRNDEANALLDAARERFPGNEDVKNLAKNLLLSSFDSQSAAERPTGE